MGNDLQRARALTRDESRTRQALERHSRNRYDLDAVRQVHRSMDGLMETLGFIARDDRFWSDLGDRAHVLAERNFDALSRFDDDGFGAILSACGYACPPPPPVDDLISDTRCALGYALAVQPSPDAVHEAQRALTIFVMRTRRQLGVSHGKAVGAAPVDSVARRASRLARKAIPVVAGTAAGAALETVFPSGVWISGGVGIGTRLAGIAQATTEKTAAKAAEKLGSDAADWAAAAVMGDALLDPPGESSYDMPIDSQSIPTPDEAIKVHVVLASDQIRTLRSKGYHAAIVDDAVLHLERLIELATDHGAPTTMRDAMRLAADALSQTRAATGSLRKDLLMLASEAVGIAEQSQHDGSGLSTEPYGSVVRQKHAGDATERLYGLCEELATIKARGPCEEILG